MARTILIMLLLALLPGALAAQYYSVVRDDGPASDVVSAANFAASMKASVGVTFTGRTTSDLRTLSESQRQDSVSVIFDGKKARIVRGGNPAFAETFDDVVEAARTYLERQGFSVTMETPEAYVSDGPSSLPDAAYGEEATPTYEDGDQYLEETVVAVPEEPRAPAAEEPPERTPGFFSRIWRWFAGIFS